MVARVLGLLGLLTSVVATLMLTLVALKFFPTLPGCGPESGCDKVTSGIWGSIPWIGWPVSFIGLCYFTSMLVIWLRGGLSRYYLWIMRLGMLCSVGFVVIMISEQALCKWCLVSHVGNLVAWSCAEFLLWGTREPRLPGALRNHWLIRRGGRDGEVVRTGDPVGGLTFVALTLVLVVALAVQNSRERARNAEGLLANQSEIAAGTTDQAAISRLKARNVIGPEDAAVQVVLFTDYQCPDCKKTEKLLATIQGEREDMSIAIKHYPYCTECNDRAFRTAHPNACWAARAAEAAGIIGGPEGFERMHNWLFDRGGSFTQVQLAQGLAELGFDPQQFLEIMTSDEVLEDVRADAEDGYQLGLFYTPMMFINGVEFKWYYGGGDINNVRKTVNIAAESGGRSVRPTERNQKLFDDWKYGRNRSTAGNRLEPWRGEGPVEVVIFGDYQHQSARQAEQILKDLQAKGHEFKYAWRHAPWESRGESPWLVVDSKNLARGVEAARELGGEEARWRAHDWAITNGGRMSQEDIAKGIAQAAGLPAAEVFATMSSPKIKNKLQRDEQDKKRTWRSHNPVILIDQRHVPRWKDPGIDSQGFIEALILSASEEPMSSGPG